MTMMHVLGGVAAVALVAGSAQAQSSKFAATYDTDEIMVEAAVNGDATDPGNNCVVLDGPDGAAGTEDDVTHCAVSAGPVYEAEVATLHVPTWKEILGTMSAQISLMTFTQAKGKNQAGTATAVAEASVRGGMLVYPEDGPAQSCQAAFEAHDSGAGNAFSAPGPVAMSARSQTLSVTADIFANLDSVLTSCTLIDLGEGVYDLECIAEELLIEGDVTVALGLDTAAAHSFQFIEDDIPSAGTQVVKACYDLSALAEVSGMDIDGDTAAAAKAILGPRIITAQQVRATKNGIIDESNSTN